MGAVLGSLLLVLLVVAIRGVLAEIPGVTPALQIQVDSSVEATSQVFVSDGTTPFDEDRSVSVEIRRGDNTLAFPLSALWGTVGSAVRWDPADVPGEFTVRSIAVTGLFGRTDIPLSDVSPAMDILRYAPVDGSLDVATGSNDGQLLVSADLVPAAMRQELLLVGLSVLLGLTVLAVVWWRRPRRSVRARWTGAPLAATFDPRSNALNSIRLILAVLVIASHTDMVTGQEGTHTFGFLGEGLVVDCFFALSGFLMARSWVRRPEWGRYLWHRTVRLVPAFWFMLVVVAIVLAPLTYLLTRGGLTGLLDSPDGPLTYLLRNATMWMVQEGISGTPSGVAYPEVWNGSAWTMGWTGLCDLLLVLLGLWGLIGRRPWVTALVLAAGLAYYSLGVLSWPMAVPTPIDVEIPLRFIVLFLAGIVLQQSSRWVPMSWPLALLATLIVAFAEAAWAQHYRVLGALPLAYLIVWLACRLPFRFGSTHDLSYGLFLFGWPAQQVLAMAGFATGNWLLFTTASTLVALPLAAACWFQVERRFMALREWTPSWAVRRRGSVPRLVPILVAPVLLCGYFAVWLVWVPGNHY